MNLRLPATLILCLGTAPLRADWKDQIGFTRLQSIAGVELPTSPTQGLTHVDAYAPNTTNYTPDTTNSLFTGKTFTLKSGASATRSHANSVATNFYSTSSQIPGTTAVDLYSASGWIASGFLNLGTISFPATETRAVQNHSWIVDTSWTSAQVEEANRRLDYAINQNGFVCVVGENNGASTTLPQFLGQSYHTISVGRTNGAHSAGFTAYDGNDRIKPDIVAPSDFTSYATPMVSGAAGLLYAKLSASPYSLTGTDRPRVVKALLLASATKGPTWTNTGTRPLDLVMGAGELNTYHAYSTLRSGKVTASASIQHGSRAWSVETVNGSSTKTYYFTIPPGAPSTPFSAALIWHREITSALSGNIFNRTRTWNYTLANLNLTLYHANGTTLGSQITKSESSVDNVELIHQSALAPGNYALRVENLAATATAYALAWHSLPAVTVAATVSTAREIDGQQGTITLTRTGDTTLPLYVPLNIAGSAIPGTHYQSLPPNVTIPAGQTSTTLQVIPVSDDLAQGTRTITVAVAADFTLVRNPSQSAVITLEDKPFDQWRFTKFTSAELADPLISHETADPDADHLANLIEYALDLEPKSSNTSPVSLIDSDGYQALSTAKNPAATDVTWAAEVTDDLETWLPADIITNTSTTFIARDTILTSAAERRFIRLKISRP